MSKKRIITICGDPGGAKAILPVIKLLINDNNFEVINYCYNEAKLIFDNNGIEFLELPINLSFENIDKSNIQNLLSSYKPQILLTATSCNNFNYEKLFILASKQLGIFSISVLDFWVNYIARFSNQNGDLEYLPDMIAVMDNNAKQEMIKLGFPKESIIVTGQPALDELSNYYVNFDQNIIKTIKESLEVDSNEILVTFVSQPISKIAVSEQSLGFNEHKVLEHLIKSLEQAVLLNNKKIFLNILAHPRDNTADYSNYNSKLLRINVSKPSNSRDYIMAADLVIGMNSILLLEACYLKKLVLSLQPNLAIEDPLPTNKIGISIGVYAYKEFLPTLKKILVSDNIGEIQESQQDFISSLNNNSANNVLQHIYNLANS